MEKGKNLIVKTTERKTNESEKVNVDKPLPSRTSIYLSRPKKYDTRYSTALNQ